MRCAACSADSAADARFCEDCGAPLSAACPNCGAAVTAGKAFCRECGTKLASGPPSLPQQGATPTSAAPVAERRVVSVLFADIVGFTPLSESRDAEEVRELLSRYFDTARTIVGRYGGVIEKFIGDALMAVWGVPTAYGDDAERAVRSAMELTEAVAALGTEIGVPGLAARAGIVTGEVAVTLGAVGQGMVAGDAVNTAARVQAAAEAGGVLVDDATRQASVAAIGYADAGAHTLKGKADPVRLWRATRVVAASGGTERIDGLEAGFLGRERELRIVKDALHACVEQRRARLVSVVGAAGVGKSRLRWELFKYVDGLIDLILWHTGRCLPYGDGVTYWALAEIVRARLDIAEQESPEEVASKLEAGLERWISSAADRDFLRPRLGVLLGIGDASLSREELFAGWRLWFERLTEHDPVLLVIEDLQWADAGLLDFVEHLLDWSADHPIFVLTLTRPELLEHRPSWAAGRRNVTPLTLEPLPEAVMGEILHELVPGLPPTVSERIVSRADGVPLYAVEMIRSLVDRDLVQPVDGTYRLVGEVDDLDVPASLASLVASRIDALPAGERALVQALAVLGGTFPRSAVAAVTDLPAAEVDALLADLVRKEILRVRTDRLSPDRGQYGFTQSMLRQVAYDTLSRRDRKSRHLAVAEHLRATFADDGAEVAEVVAQHYRDAYDAVRDDPDAGEIARQACDAFIRSGQRARAMGAPEAAQRAYQHAADLARDDAERARCLADAGAAAFQASRYEAAVELLQSAVDAHRAAGRDREAAKVTEVLAHATSGLGLTDRAISLLEPAMATVSQGPPDETTARVHDRLSHLLIFAGRGDEAAEHIETALELAQALELPEVLVSAAGSKAMLLARANRHQEALAMFDWAADVADRNGFTQQSALAHGNAADLALNGDMQEAGSRHLAATLATARRRGDPSNEGFVVYNQAVADLMEGRWDQVEASAADALRRFEQIPIMRLFAHSALGQLHALRGQLDLARADLAELEEMRTHEDVQDQAMYRMVAARTAASAREPGEALRLAREAILLMLDSFGLRHEFVRTSWPVALDAALTVGDLAGAEELLAIVADRPIGHVPPYMRAELARFRARIAAARDEHEAAGADFLAAEAMLSDLGYPYALALARRDHGAWLLGRNRAGEARPHLLAADATFDSLRAAPALAITRELLGSVPEAVTV
ncbi:MAG TPA: adenylate/guanylate cyclase domain-containing protein [Mycobacteriales bacterium]|nr:adenylate/guanylate cyclase domain-containing protein [Mycobacteriales bacterium]